MTWHYYKSRRDVSNEVPFSEIAFLPVFEDFLVYYFKIKWKLKSKLLLIKHSVIYHLS